MSDYYSNNDWRYYIQSRNELIHFGIPRRSGRYPWGSGENPYHHGESAPGNNRTKKKKASPVDNILQKKRDAAEAKRENRRDKRKAHYDAVKNEKNAARALKTAVLGNDELRAKKKTIDAETNKRLSRDSLLINNKLKYSNKAFNDKNLADYYTKRSKMSGKERLKEKLLKTELLKTPYKNARGKTTTIGRDKLERLGNKALKLTMREVLTGGAGIKTVEGVFVSAYVLYKMSNKGDDSLIGIPEQKERRLHTFDGKHYF